MGISSVYFNTSNKLSKNKWSTEMKTYLVKFRITESADDELKINADILDYGAQVAKLQTSDNKILAVFPLDKLIGIVDLSALSKDKV